MLTPEQIATETLNGIDWRFPDDWDTLHELIATAVKADRAQRAVPDPSPADERLIRDGLEEFAVRYMESQNLNLSDGMKPLTEWNTGGKPLNTDQIIRMVQSTLRAYVNRDA